MRVLLTGAGGQLGRALRACAPGHADLILADRAALDLADADAIHALVAQVRPEVILNAAAYTAVDRAEREEALALAVNGAGVGHLAAAARAAGARLVHLSTDFVFDGASSTPYRPDGPANPLSAYGRTKLAGERAAGPAALIVRTSWVYAPTGHNFVRTMMRRMAGHEAVRVVADQIGSPTYAPGLAGALWRLVERQAQGVLHYSDSGVASWYDFAVAIQEEALALGLLERAVPVIPIATADFPSPARRPACSVLDKSATSALLGGPAPHWRVNLRHMLKEIATHG